MLIPDYLVYEELKKRQEEWQPEVIPLWHPEHLDTPRPDDTDQVDMNRGVVIIDMNSVDEIDSEP